MTGPRDFGDFRDSGDGGGVAGSVDGRSDRYGRAGGDGGGYGRHVGHQGRDGRDDGREEGDARGGGGGGGGGGGDGRGSLPVRDAGRCDTVRQPSRGRTLDAAHQRSCDRMLHAALADASALVEGIDTLKALKAPAGPAKVRSTITT